MTGPDGRFWTMIDRGDLEQARGNPPGGEIRLWVPPIDEEAAQRLVFHLPLREEAAPETTGIYPLYYVNPNTGLVCNGHDCTLCGVPANR
jgi:hypothetical protein